MSQESRGRNASAGGSLLESLSGEPEDSLSRKLSHHGSRVGLLLLVAASLTLFFPPSARLDLARYDIGMVATEDMLASIPFAVPKPREQLERERADAAAAVPPTFHVRPAAGDSMATRLQSFFRALAESEEPEAQQALEEVGIPMTPAQLQTLRDPARVRLLEQASVAAARQLLPRGVVDGAQGSVITTDRVIVTQDQTTERYVPRDSILTAREFYDQAGAFLPPGAPPDLQELHRLVLIRFLQPSLLLDVEATERDRDAARRSVPTTKASILAGEAIVRANQQVGEAEVERMLAYEEQLRNQGRLEDSGRNLMPYLGSIVLNSLILGIFGLLLFFYRTEIYADFRWLLLQAFLVLAYFGAGGLLARNDFPWELLPIAFVALAVAVLWDSRMALVLALVVAILTVAQPPYFGDASVLFVTVAGGAAAALSVRVVRRRAQTWIFIALIAAAYATALLALALVTGRGGTPVLGSIGWTALNATGSAILAMGFVPVFEWFSRITTDQTLLEWADPNRPLLKRLSLEAPGTYAHTINVANLAEAAATAVGANPLLCRVGVYYHDVGKMLKPQYFIENQPGVRNPHDKLKPSTSAAIVREHVTEGLRMAREAKLPEVLLDFIPEHHGTQLISFFYERARAEAEMAETGEMGSGAGGGSKEKEEPRGASDARSEASSGGAPRRSPYPDPAEFSYPGPRPRSKETAIVMLADTVESATRSLQDPSPERLRELIDTLIDAKIRDGQLDEAPITLQDVRVIKDQFLKVLGGMYHHRIDYPTTQHLTRRSGEPADGGEGGEPDERAGKGGTAARKGEERKGAANRTGERTAAEEVPDLFRS